MIDHSPSPENPLAASQLALNDLITTAPSPESLSDSELEDMHRFVAYAMRQVAVLGEAVVAEQVRREEVAQEPERYTLNDAQRSTLQALCERYGVRFEAEHYYVYPPDSSIMKSYAEGWLGGFEHKDKTLYVGVSPEGRAHS